MISQTALVASVIKAFTDTRANFTNIKRVVERQWGWKDAQWYTYWPTIASVLVRLLRRRADEEAVTAANKIRARLGGACSLAAAEAVRKEYIEGYTRRLNNSKP